MSSLTPGKSTPPAVSFACTAASQRELARELANALGSFSDPAGALLFASGVFGDDAVATLRTLRRVVGQVPAVLAVSSGTLSDRGEQEGVSSVTGVMWRGGSCVTVSVPASETPEAMQPRLQQAVSEALGTGSGTLVLLADPTEFSPSALSGLRALGDRLTVVGGGTLPKGAWVLQGDGTVSRGGAVGLLLKGGGRLHVRASAACRLLAPFRRITQARGSLVLKVDDEPALAFLSASAGALPGQPLVFAVLSEGPAAPRPGQGGVLLRSVRGVDSARQGVMVSDEVAPGMLITFGVCDPNASRSDLEGCLRELARDSAGAAPRYALYFNCAGRGSGFYGAPDVDIKLLRAAFPNLPLAGMFSSFEIGPVTSGPAVYLYTGIVALFTAPS